VSEDTKVDEGFLTLSEALSDYAQSRASDITKLVLDGQQREAHTLVDRIAGVRVFKEKVDGLWSEWQSFVAGGELMEKYGDSVLRTDPVGSVRFPLVGPNHPYGGEPLFDPPNFDGQKIADVVQELTEGEQAPSFPDPAAPEDTNRGEAVPAAPPGRVAQTPLSRDKIARYLEPLLHLLVQHDGSASVTQIQRGLEQQYSGLAGEWQGNLRLRESVKQRLKRAGHIVKQGKNGLIAITPAGRTWLNGQ
jgi:hypothetical protein